MPVYEYVCEKCHTTTEALRKMADADAELACEQCGGAKMTRKHSVFAAGAAAPGGGDVSLPMGGGGCGCGNPHGPCAR